MPSSRNESPAQVANIHSVMTLGAERGVRQVLLYELVETAQAILISYILIDGSAQAVSYIVGVISTWIRNLR